MKLSIIMPVFNEISTIEEILSLVFATGHVQEIIIIDDGSTDGTRDFLTDYVTDHPQIKLILHETNLGKGAAVRNGIKAANADLVLIQDADLEYDPRDYDALMQPILEGKADVVYGSRFMGSPRRSTMFWHMVANKLLTLMTNIMFDSILTDMETCYKLFKRDVIQSLTLRSNRFDIEPEITAKILKGKFRVFEVPISFNPREYDEGKKIGLKDAFAAIWALLRYRFFD